MNQINYVVYCFIVVIIATVIMHSSDSNSGWGNSYSSGGGGWGSGYGGGGWSSAGSFHK